MAFTYRVSGSKIRSARLSAGMTQAQLARAVSTSERNIVRWENDRNAPRAEAIAAIAQVTGKTVGELMDDDSPPDEDDEESDPVADLMSALRVVVRAELAKVTA